MMQETNKCASCKAALPIPVIPSFPENIRNVQKPNKEEIVKNHISRFQ